MRRRTVLQNLGGTALVLGTTGCLSTTQPSTPTGRTITIHAVDSLPESIDASFTVTIRQKASTTDQPPSIRITFTNTGDEKKKYLFSDYAPFTETKSVESNPGVVLLLPGTDYKQVAPDCWQPTPGASIGYDALGRNVSLKPSASIHRDAQLWGSPRNDDNICLPTGKFRFEHDYEFEWAAPFTWGFTIKIR